MAPPLTIENQQHRVVDPAVRIAMTPTPASKRSVVIAFATLGFCAGWVFMPTTMDWLYYTTKPMAFIGAVTLWVFAVLFAASLSAIPLFAPQGGDAGRSPGLRVLLVFGFVWSVSAGVALLIVRTVTAHIHNTTLSIPEPLVPGGLFFIPVFAGLVVLLAGIWVRKRYGPSF
jgi:hypothetical protein